MSNVKLEGNEVRLNADVLKVNDVLPRAKLCNFALEDVDVHELATPKLILNIFPSLDTGICADSIKSFARLTKDNGITLRCISRDLPFAQHRFCEENKINQDVMLSDYRSDFGDKAGLVMVDGALRNLLARAVIVLNEQKKVIYIQLVPEITTPPDYKSAVNACK